LSKDRYERVSRNEEIRAIFIFGLLAVFAYVKTQFATLNLVYTFGTFDLIVIINILLVLWSMYALFMVLGLSRDTLGKSASRMFRDSSKMFLQYSYAVLAIFMVLFGFLIFGVLRIVLFLFIVGTIGLIAAFFYFENKPKILERKLSFKEIIKIIIEIKNYILQKIMDSKAFIVGLLFLFSATGVMYYPDNWFASDVLIFVFFTAAVFSVSYLLYLRANKRKEVDEYSI
jgi:hypothetical protein